MAKKISFYFDEMMPRPVANELSKRGVGVVMAIDVGMMAKNDQEHLQWAVEHEHSVVTCDRAFAGVVSTQLEHKGLICWTGVLDDMGGMVRKLSEFAEQYSSEEVAGRVFWVK